MLRRYRFDIYKLHGRSGKIRDWMRNHSIPKNVTFILLGIISTVWFLIRVIPKPSRAAYPCMRIAAPFMSGFILYLLSVWALTVAAGKQKLKIINVRFASTFMLIFGVVAVMAISPSGNIQSLNKEEDTRTGPSDGPNEPMGTGIAVNPGRVIWVWDPKATSENCVNAFELSRPENTNQGVVNRMVADAVKKLSGKNNLRDSWDALFRAFNLRKLDTGKTYSAGQRIFIKINQGTANSKLRTEDINNGLYIPERMTNSEDAKRGFSGTCETYPNVVLEILRELVYVVGIDQKNIAIGDPISHIFGQNYDVWATEFPEVVYVDRSTDKWGRTLINPTKKDLIFYSDKTQSDKLYDIIENADYLINVANLKPHGRAGVSLTAKNHFGSHSRPSASHLHYSLISPVSFGRPTNNGYRKYRVMVDLMGSRYLGQNTLLSVVDGLYGGGSNETRVPVKYFMNPFKNDWCNSLFLSQDQVALESVCYDFLRTEWNGTFKHNPANNAYEEIPNVFGVDDYLHQAADPANWPKGIVYDPDNEGKPLTSLGIHEHWNNPDQKQYSRNLGKPYGIELVSIPDTLVKYSLSANSSKSDNPETLSVTTTKRQSKTKTGTEENNLLSGNARTDTETRKGEKHNVMSLNFNPGFPAKKFHSVLVDGNNIKWFLTDAGIVSFNGKIWSLHNKNRKVPANDLRSFAYDLTSYGHELWVASPAGATVVTIPVDARSGATTYHTENTTIVSDNVLSIAIGKSPLRWFGTDKGISAFYNKKWLSNSYQRKYPESLFKDFPITSMAASPDGDSLYVGTLGAGVARVYRNKVDGVSGASEYAQWGPIELPSDNIYSILVASDGTQWFGTDMGVARHEGYKTLENWKIFTIENGLVNNFVQALAIDKAGHIWFGTKGGASVFDGIKWISYTTKEGLINDNILSIAIDKEGIVWLGTEDGVVSIKDWNITNFTQ